MQQKKKDMFWMGDELIISKDYHQFYRDLSVIGSEERSTDDSDTGTAVVVDATEANVCSVPDAPGVRTRSSIASDVNKTKGQGHLKTKTKTKITRPRPTAAYKTKTKTTGIKQALGGFN